MKRKVTPAWKDVKDVQGRQSYAKAPAHAHGLFPWFLVPLVLVPLVLGSGLLRGAREFCVPALDSLFI